MEGERKGTAFDFGAEVSVRDEGERKPEGWWYAASRFRARLPDLEGVGKLATRRALVQLGAKPEKSGAYPCVVENVVAARLLSDLLSPLSGGMIQQKRSFLADKLGQAIAAPVFTLIDEPHLPEGLASRTYDGEGMSTRRRPLFEGGVLASFLLDTYYASKLGVAPTTGGTSNLEFAQGSKDLPGLLSAMGTGILISGFSGGNSNPATGDFSVGVRGQWVENGVPGKAIAEMNLSGNHLSFWKGLVELGNDPFPYSSTRIPSLRFSPVQFSGV
jgi:PmbA protein